jgi:hypothetical protein
VLDLLVRSKSLNLLFALLRFVLALSSFQSLSCGLNLFAHYEP